MQEGELFVRATKLVELVARQGQCRFDERHHETVNSPDPRVVSASRNQGLEWTQHGRQHLDALDLIEGLGELGARVGQAVDRGAKQKVGRHIERHAVKEVHDVDGGAVCGDKVDERLSPAIKDGQVAHAVLDEHGTDEAARVVPEGPVGGEDAVTQKWPPELVEPITLAKGGKLACQDRLDVLWISRDQISLARPDLDLDNVAMRVSSCSLSEHGFKVLQQLMRHLRAGTSDEP